MKKNVIYYLLLVISTSTYSSEIVIGFSPGGAAQTIILNAIGDAKKTIDVAAHSFTSKAVSESLLSAKKRGVDVRVIADMESNKNYTAVNFISNKGITVRLNSKYKSMHNKFMIIDNQSIQTGSYNYSAAANKSNAENVIYIKNDENIASKYTIEFNRLWNESAPLVLKY